MMEMEPSTAIMRLVDTVLDGKESARLREIRGSHAPWFVKTWFQLGVESWYAPEYARRLAQPRFDFQDSDVQTLAHQFDHAVKDTARFTRPDCEKIIEGAIRHEISYLRQPIPALSALLFRQSGVVDSRHVADLLTRFQRESYYVDALTAHSAAQSDTRLDQDLLEQLLANVEHEAYQQHSMETLAAAMAAVSEILCLIGGTMETDQVSLEVWASFFETRHLQEYFQHYQAVIEGERARGRQTLSSQELWKALQEDRSAPPAIEPVAPAAEAIPLTEPTPVLDATPEPPALPVETEWSAVSVPEQPVEDVVPPSFSIPPLEDAPELPPSQPTESQTPPVPPSWMADVVTTSPSLAPRDRVPVSSLPPVEINEKLERMFIRKLFNKDSQFYNDVLAQLEKATSWEESFSIIEEVWEQRGLNLFSKESQEFTRVFYERFYHPT